MPGNSDPLADLLVDSAEVDRKAIAAALKGVVGIDPKAKGVVTQSGFDTLNVRQQVVALLLGAKVARLLDVLDSDSMASRDVVAQSGLAGGTARPVLRDLLERRSISQDSQGRYFIAHHQVADALSRLGEREVTGPTEPRRRRKRASTKGDKSTTAKATGRRASSGVTGAIHALVESGFFGSPRTLRDIQDRLRKKKGINADLPKISPIMLKLLRSDVLDRDQNADGVYEYFTKDA